MPPNPHFMQYQLEARSRQQHLISYLALTKSDTLLDVGCGTGYFAGLLEEQIRFAVGVDVDPSALLAAKSIVKNVDFICADVTRLPIKSCAVSRVLCTEVLEHVPDDEGLVSECNRVLISGGLLVCSSPNRVFPFRSEKTSHLAPGPECHVRQGYSMAELRHLLSTVGFSDICSSYALPLVGTLVVELLERAYSVKYGPLKSQADLARLQRSKVFSCYRFAFRFLMLTLSIKFPEALGGSIIVAKALRSSGSVH